MALTVTYQASLRTLSYTATGTVDSSEAMQEYYTSAANRVGLLHFASMSMENKVITGISITATAKRAGYGLGHEKTVYIRKSNYQATSQSGVKGRDFVGDLMGTFTGYFYGNTSTYELTGTLLTNLAEYFSAGNNTLILYNPNPQETSQGYSRNYLRWEEASITITYQEAASQPTLSVTEADMGTEVTITTNRQSTAATHTLRYSFLNDSGTIAENAGDSATWTPPVSLAAQIPNASSDFCTIYCDTYINDSLIATTQCAFTLKVPADVKPTITSISYAEATAGISAAYGVYVRTISTLSVAVTASGAQKSTITSYRAAIDGTTYSGSSFVTHALGTAGSNTLTFTVTDSRGRTATETRTINVVDYSRPSLTAFAVKRTTGASDSEGEQRVQVCIAATASPVNQKNTMSVVFYYRYKNAQSWVQTLSLAAADYTDTASEFVDNYTVKRSNLILPAQFSVLDSYDIRVVIRDAFNTVEAVADIGTTAVLVDFHSSGKGVAFGKIAESEECVEFGWPLQLSEPLGMENGGTGATDGASACEKLGAVKKTGDTMTGTLYIQDAENPRLILNASATFGTNGILNRAVIGGSYVGNAFIGAYNGSGDSDARILEVRSANYFGISDFTMDEALMLTCYTSGSSEEYRVYHEGMSTPIPVSMGGTGANDAKTALENMGIIYAETLPEDGTDGQICLVPV